MRNNKGFTLIELLVVIGILAVLLAITLIAINPAEQLERGDDIKRQSDVTQILNAIGQYAVDNNGQLPPTGVTLSTDPLAPTEISSAGVGQVFCEALVTEFIAGLPSDPATNSGNDITQCDPAVAPNTGTWDTGYAIYESTNNRVTVLAPDANEGPIEATR